MALTVTHTKTLVSPDSGAADKVYGVDYVSSTSHSVTGGTASDVGLGNVTNDTQTKAAIVPNTAPTSGQILVGNAGGTAYAAVSLSGDATLASTGAITLGTSGVTAGTYGDSSHVGQIVLDAKGRVTAATSIAIAVAAALSSLSAASTSNTIANGNNTGQVWNWANTTDSTIAFTIGETSAGTNGTSTSGVPNQVLLKLTTLAASTQSPLSVYSRGSHVFSVSPTAGQILGTDGGPSSPTYSFASGTSSGVYSGGGDVRISAGGTLMAIAGSSNFKVLAGTVGVPGLGFTSDATTGIFFSSPNMGLSLGGAEELRWLAGIWQPSHGSANAVGYAINARKSRGTVASPTVITTGDVAHTISGYAFVGATNTYQEITRASSVSNGTISDATTGVGGYFAIFSRLQGTDTAVQENVRFQNGSQPIAIWSPITFANLGTPANGAFAFCSDCDVPTVVDNTCTSAGGKTGAFAIRINGAWKCVG